MKKQMSSLLQKIMAVLLTAALFVGMVQEILPVTAQMEELSVRAQADIPASGVSGTGWTLDADGNLTIESDEGMEDWWFDSENGRQKYGKQIISATIKEGVTKIINSAFYENYNLASVTIPESVESIGSSAFYSCVLQLRFNRDYNTGGREKHRGVCIL